MIPKLRPSILPPFPSSLVPQRSALDETGKPLDWGRFTVYTGLDLGAVNLGSTLAFITKIAGGKYLANLVKIRDPLTYDDIGMIETARWAEYLIPKI